MIDLPDVKTIKVKFKQIKIIPLEFIDVSQLMILGKEIALDNKIENINILKDKKIFNFINK